MKRNPHSKACKILKETLSKKVEASLSLSPSVKVKCCYYGSARYARLIKRQISSSSSQSNVEKVTAVPVTRSHVRQMKNTCFYELS